MSDFTAAGHWIFNVVRCLQGSPVNGMPAQLDQLAQSASAVSAALAVSGNPTAAAEAAAAAAVLHAVASAIRAIPLPEVQSDPPPMDPQ